MKKYESKTDFKSATKAANKQHTGTYRNLLITKLVENIRDEHLLNFFQPYGALSASVMTDATTGKGKGYGFVLFSSEAEGQAARDKFNRTKVNIANCTLRIEAFPSKHDGRAASEPNEVLYMRNVPAGVSEMTLWLLLQQYGLLESLVVRTDRHDAGKLMITAKFETISSATAALRELHRSTLFHTEYQMLVKYAEKKACQMEQQQEVAAPPESVATITPSDAKINETAQPTTKISASKIAYRPVPSSAVYVRAGWYRHEPYTTVSGQMCLLRA